jgi:hypothetical protein
LSKSVAGRDRDWDYATEALDAGIVDSDVLLARVLDLPVEDAHRDHVEQMLRSIIASR